VRWAVRCDSTSRESRDAPRAPITKGRLRAPSGKATKGLGIKRLARGERWLTGSSSSAAARLAGRGAGLALAGLILGYLVAVPLLLLPLRTIGLSHLLAGKDEGLAV
jgi:hypothetical protein